MNTNQMTSGSIVTVSGLTKKLKQSEVNRYFDKLRNDGYQGEVNVTIEFKTESQGLKAAKRFKRLAENPLVKLNLHSKT